jgi:predicted Fe-Mo cluster-binding NifX family protein
LTREIDATDKKILFILSENSQLSQAEISKQLNISQPAVSARIRKMEDKGLESKTSAHFGNVPFLAFIELENKQTKNVYVKVNKAARIARKKGISAAQFLVDEKVDEVLAGGMGEGPFHLLRDNLVQIFVLPEQVELKEAIRLLNENKLERMTTPFEKNETDDK